MNTLLEEGFSLSKTEFIAYLKCPFSFYLLKDLSEENEFQGWRDYSDYEPSLESGLKKHRWFQNFFQEFSEDIRNKTYPKVEGNNIEKLIKQKFIEFEMKRYEQNPHFWEPIAVEFYIKNQSYRGKIDRIDQLNEQGHCCIVEYKPSQRKFDEEELLFYASLLINSLPHIDLPTITKVTEIGIYYYNTAEFYKAKITREDMNTFEQYLMEICFEMLQPSNMQKKKHCDFDQTNCLNREICRRIKLD